MRRDRERRRRRRRRRRPATAVVPAHGGRRRPVCGESRRRVRDRRMREREVGGRIWKEK
jgi:glyoxylase-like metal-dependent hydrolase (beta-lactamase superfamily II)